MAVDSVSSALQAATSTSQTSGAKLSETFDTFLTLLTTQLKHQDPLDPMDSAAFTEQLVQFSSVEQQIQSNKNLESLIGLQKSSMAGASVSYIGKKVTALGDTVALKDGAANWSYALGEEADECTLVIKDQSGKIVATRTGETSAGRHVFTWDGTDNQGQALPDGLYTLQAGAQTADDKAVDVAVGIEGIVTGVSFAGSEPELVVNGTTVILSNILSVMDATQTAMN